jgi:hypothetical protein
VGVTCQPAPLPYCAYPKAADVAQHGVQPLPAVLPLVDFERARVHRSRRYTSKDNSGSMLYVIRLV